MSTIAFTGASGHGKSTLVAALAHCSGGSLGYDVIDKSAMTVGGAIVEVRPPTAVMVVSVADGPTAMTLEHAGVLARNGCKSVVLFLSKTDLVDDPELVDLIEFESRDYLTAWGYPGDDVPAWRGSALLAAQSSGPQDSEDANTIFVLADALAAFARN